MKTNFCEVCFNQMEVKPNVKRIYQYLLTKGEKALLDMYESDNGYDPDQNSLCDCCHKYVKQTLKKYNTPEFKKACNVIDKHKKMFNKEMDKIRKYPSTFDFI